LNETNFWWSHTGFAAIAALESQDATLTGCLGLSLWSDSLGHLGSEAASCTYRFDAAVQHIRSIGLSLGAGCYYDNGIQLVSGSGAASFRLVAFTAA
jgi:hypothetical protein